MGLAETTPTIPRLRDHVHPPTRRQNFLWPSAKTLKISGIIARAGQSRDFSPRKLGREPLQTDIRKLALQFRPNPFPITAMTQWVKRNGIAHFLIASLFVISNQLYAQGTAFTYQGRLQSGTTVANGSYDLTFSVWNSAAGPSQIGNTVTNAATSVANGIFMAALDFGSGVFDGNSRWLEISVRTNGNDAFTTLSPRQPLMPAPYSIYAGGVNAAGISGTIPAGNIASGTITSSMLATGAVAANLSASGQSAVPSGAMILSANPNATNLSASGYVRIGGQLDLCWQQRANSGASVISDSYMTPHWTGSEMILWGWREDNNAHRGGRYNPTANTWSIIATNGQPTANVQYTTVWTGSELIAWAEDGSVAGSRYNPTSNSWTPMTTIGVPDGLTGRAVWTGSEMIIWGANVKAGNLNMGVRYNPSTDSWSLMATNGEPTAPADYAAVWTGTEIIIWGGPNNDKAGRYNPSTDTWSPVTTNNAPAMRTTHTAIWTGSEMIIWGGSYYDGTSSTRFNDGARYSPATDSWLPIATNNAPKPRLLHTAVWTGSEMIIWGGTGNGGSFSDGGRYDPTANSWSPVTITDAPPKRYAHNALWTGSEMLIIGGIQFFQGQINPIYLEDTYSYNPSRTMYLYLRP